MTESKLVITYRKDESLNQMTTTSYHLRSQSGEPILNLQNGMIAKRRVAKNQDKPKTLKRVVLDSKIHRLNINFVRKLRLNSILRPPLQNIQDHNDSQQSDGDIVPKMKIIFKCLSSAQGIELGSVAVAIWSFLNIIQTIIMVFIFSIMMSFGETQAYSLFFYMRTLSCALYGLDMILNFISQRYENGKKLCLIGEISSHYLKNGFLIDIVSLLVIPIDIVVKVNINIILSLIYLIKLINSIRKLEKFEYLFLTTKQKQQYYGLIKVFLTNFAIGHFLSVFLNLMPNLSQENNWHLKLGIYSSSWYIKYIWGYYWGTNIMLTVGFGDITATNEFEAIILVFIQTFSCITLAYNISYVGGLIASIRQNQECKKGKLKTFHRMCKQNQVSNEIQSKISNFIDQSFQIKQNFGHQAHDELMEFLPKNMQRQYRKQANKIIFDSLGFLNNLSKKSLLKLAEEVNRKICHPEQIIFKKGEVTDFMILQKGLLAFTCKTGPKSDLDGKTIQHLSVQNKTKPKILTLDFIKNKTLGFNIKSVNYSVLYYLNREDFMESLRSSQMDYQLFCFLKDKDECMLDQNNLYPCANCKNSFHSKFQCSRLHYVPLKQNVVIRFLEKQLKKRQKRVNFSRHMVNMSSLLSSKQVKQCQIKFIRQNFDEYHYKQIETLVKFYKQRAQLSLKNQHFDTVIETLHELAQRSIKHRKHLGTYMYKNIFQEKAIDKLESLIEATKNQHKFWDIEIDAVYDFRYYFKEGNSENLKKMKKYRKHRFDHPLLMNINGD